MMNEEMKMMEELYSDDVMEAATESFVIDNDMKADWAVRRIAAIEAETQRMLDFYKDQSEKLKAQCDQRTAYFKGLLQRYLMTVPARETKTQMKHSLPSADLVLRKPALKYEHDDQQLLKWLQQNDMSEFTQVKITPAWGELKKHLSVVGDSVILTDTGEIVEGVTAGMSDPEFVVKVKEEEK